MGIIRQLFDKSIASGLNLKSDKTKSRQKVLTWQATFEDRTPKSEDIVKNVSGLLLKFPDSPEFLGKKLKYPKKKKKRPIFFKRPPNLVELRDEVNRFSESKEVLDPRSKIIKLLKKHPYYPDLRAINGIQVFNDALQSGLDQKKLGVLENSFVEIGSAVNNGGLSIFNVSWFIKIYLRYLELLRDRYNSEYNSIKESEYTEVKKAAESLNRAILQTTSMMSIRDKLGGLAMLNAKLKGSVYISSIIDEEEIKAACKASLQHDMSRSVGNGKTANYVILVVLTLGLLIARIPVLKQLVSDLLKSIPDITKDLILQKNMISTMTIVTDFQLSIASGDKEKSRLVADRLFNRCKNVISQHLEYSILTKPQEVDPFLKAAWIAKESNGLMREAEYRIRLEESLKYLKIITGNQGKVKGAFELARQLQSDISFIMAEYGWSFF
ncbi:hypothetical protein KJ966_06320 [bacterium]|nr:hypothetical protein [bacterium]